MGYLVIGTHTEGWTPLAGELLPSDLPALGLESDIPEPQYRRGPHSGPRYALGDLPSERISNACREGRHWAPERPDGSCHGKRLTNDYEWKPCECPCHGQEVK